MKGQSDINIFHESLEVGEVMRKKNKEHLDSTLGSS